MGAARKIKRGRPAYKPPHPPPPEKLGAVMEWFRKELATLRDEADDEREALKVCEKAVKLGAGVDVRPIMEPRMLRMLKRQTALDELLGTPDRRGQQLQMLARLNVASGLAPLGPWWLDEDGAAPGNGINAGSPESLLMRRACAHLTYSQMADVLDVSEDQVRWRMSKLGLNKVGKRRGNFQQYSGSGVLH